MLGVLIETVGSIGVRSSSLSAIGSSTFGSSISLGIVSVSFAAEASDSAIDPAYSVTEAAEGVREVIERVPESSRTRNCEIEGFIPPVGEDERVGAVSLLNGLDGRCCARMSWSTLLSDLYRAVPNLALFARAGALCADAAAPPSSASSLISSKRVDERAGEAV